MNQEPSQLLKDQEGRWYLVPESAIVRFEDAQARLDSEGDSEGDSDDAIRCWEAVSRQIKRLSPSSLRILAWEEMD